MLTYNLRNNFNFLLRHLRSDKYYAPYRTKSLKKYTFMNLVAVNRKMFPQIKKVIENYDWKVKFIMKLYNDVKKRSD